MHTIEIYEDEAAALTVSVLVEHYKDLLQNNYCDTEERHTQLIDAYKVVIDYNTTAEQRAAHGIT